MDLVLTAVVLPFQIVLFSVAGWMFIMACLLPIIAVRDIIQNKLYKN